MRYQPAIERLLLVVWLGAIWSVGFLVAPTLFAMLDDRSIAGNIAGRLFIIVSHIGLVCGVLLLVLAFKQSGVAVVRHWRAWVVGLMLLLTILGQYVVAPMMQDIRQARLQNAFVSPELYQKFQTLHGISSSLFVLTSLLGLVIVVAGVLPASSREDSDR